MLSCDQNIASLNRPNDIARDFLTGASTEPNSRSYRPSVSVIFVNYKRCHDTLLRCKKVISALFDFRLDLIVIDNSPYPYFGCFAEQLDELDTGSRHSVLVLHNKKNCRFRAYNIGLNLAHKDFIFFRSDDDDFDETIVREYLLTHQNKRADHITAFEYFYEDTRQRTRSARRPIETIALPNSPRLSSFRVPEKASGDWLFLQQLKEQFCWKFSDLVVMRKVRHGRN